MRGETDCLEDLAKNGEIKGEWLNGIYNELADLLGMDAAMEIHSAYRGQQVNTTAGKTTLSSLPQNTATVKSG